MVKFDVVIGNPPYQEDNEGENESYSAPIYPEFMDSAYKIGEKVTLVTPGRFLFNAGATKKSWNEKMLKDKHVKVVHYQSDSAKMFNNTNINGGIAITYRDKNREFDLIGTFIPFDELESIAKKVHVKDFSPLTNIIKNQTKFNLEALYNDYPNVKSLIGSDGKDKRIRSNAFDKLPVFTDTKDNSTDIRILGLQNKKRVYKYISRDYVQWDDRIDAYEVFVPAANGASGTLSDKPARMISKPVIGLPNEGMTQTFIGFGKFCTNFEAESCFKYINSKFTRVLLGVLKVTQSNNPDTWSKVPLQDFTKDSDIDWSKSIAEIDQQLYTKYGLSDEEITFIETHVKEME